MINRIKITLLILFTNYIMIGQTKFEYNKDGLEPKYLVVEIKDKNVNEIYNKAINWIKETYKNPDEVIKTTIKNDKIRFEGFKGELICVKSLGLESCYNSTYTIEIEFKNGRYKFEPLNLKYRMPASQYSSGREEFINFEDGSGFYKKNGNIRNSWKTIPKSIEDLFNNLNSELRNYINKEDKDDW